MQLLEVDIIESYRDACRRRTVYRTVNGTYAIDDCEMGSSEPRLVPMDNLSWLNCRVKDVCDCWK